MLRICPGYRVTSNLWPCSPAKRSASREEATAIPRHGIFPGLRRKRLTRTIGNLRYCSPGTRCAPSPGEEHGVAEFPGGDAAHLSGLPDGVQQAKKKPVLAYELFLKYGGEGGIDSLRSPSGQIPRRLVICPTGCRQLSNPGRGFSSPPAGCYMRKKSPYLRTSSS